MDSEVFLTRRGLQRRFPKSPIVADPDPLCPMCAGGGLIAAPGKLTLSCLCTWHTPEERDLLAEFLGFASWAEVQRWTGREDAPQGGPLVLDITQGR